MSGLPTILMRTAKAKAALEAAGSRNLNFDELKSLVEASPVGPEIIALLVTSRSYRPDDWHERLALLRWISLDLETPLSVSYNASLAWGYTALHLGENEAAFLAEEKSRAILGNWEKLPDHRLHTRKNRIHFYFSHLALCWPVALLCESMEKAEQELGRGREFFLNLPPTDFRRPVISRTVQNISRALLADSIFAFVRKDFGRVEENHRYLTEAFQKASFAVHGAVGEGFLNATSTLTWSNELLSRNLVGKSIPVKTVIDSRNVALGALKVAARVTGEARTAVFESIDQVLKIEAIHGQGNDATTRDIIGRTAEFP